MTWYDYQVRFGLLGRLFDRFVFRPLMGWATAWSFDATMVYSTQRNRIVDYLGTHQHLAVDIHLSVAENGGLKLRSGAQRFYEGPIGFSFPMLFSGYADVCEWYDDATDQFRIQVVISNRTWGKLFGYTGRFTVQYCPVEEVPRHVKPVREEMCE